MKVFHLAASGLRYLVIAPILLYRHIISPMIPSRCIYSPSCSEYSIEAIKRHGVLKGLILGSFRIGRCHSMFTGGDDPVPKTVSWKQISADYRRFRDRD
ncbi:MAG: membrane protein insertion efficiency factor YidD [Spirochaetia bacterium]|nr:membrane protein insertion efficiency factor YidD [Spirochaetia bacterium]